MWAAIRLHRNQVTLTLISGLVLTLAFPKVDLGVLAWVAMVPFLIAIRAANTRTGFLLGLLFGMAHNLGLFYWTAQTMHTYGHLPMIQALVVLTLLAIYLSGFQAVFAATICWLRPRPAHLIFLAPAVWVVLELLRARLFSGFPWALLGYSQYDHPWVIQIADLFGVYGISGLIVLTNTLSALVLLHWTGRTWRRAAISRRLLIRGGLVLAVLLLGVNSYGILRMDTVDRAMRTADKIIVTVVQGNIDQALKWDAQFQLFTTARYLNLSLEASTKKVDLVIWPETATPFYFSDGSALSQMVIKGIQSAKAHFIIGSPSYAEGPERTLFYNSAYMITPQGKISGRYDKVHLLPFGEYVPMSRWLPFIKKMVAQVGDFMPGRRGDTLTWSRGEVGMLICYEVIFPGLSRSMVQNGADLLVTITNDAWFGLSSAPYQHFSMAVLRAVENRRSVARAANSGISGFIDPNGRVSRTALFTTTTASQEVALLKEITHYAQWGDWPMGLLGFGVLLSFVVTKTYRRPPIFQHWNKEG